MIQDRTIYFYHKHEPEIHKEIDSLKNLVSQYGFTIVDHSKEANIIASLGGDGTFLQAVRQTGFREDCLYIGMSTTDSLSLYSDFQLQDAAKLLDAMTSQQMEVRSTPTLEVTINNHTTYNCLNEFSIQSSIVKTFIMDVFIDDLHFETFRGDGLVISTPTGSTAYNKSVNGAVVDHLLPCIQITELASLNNNDYRTLGSPFILSQDRVLTLKIVKEGNEYPTMAMDNEAITIHNLEKIEIKLSDKKISTLKLKDNSFWEKVKRVFV
jgi:NAD+ kinase